MTTLSDGVTTLDLSPDLLWSDEFTWQAVEASVTRTWTGALVVQNTARVAGRPITLEGDAPNVGWLTRTQLEQCHGWASIPEQMLALTYRGVNRTVFFRHQDGAIESTPVVPFNDVQPGDFYVVRLRLMEA